MMRALRRYLNAALIGFVLTFIVYLYIRLPQDEITRGILISLVGAVVVLAAYTYLDYKFGREPELYDKDGNLVSRDGKVIKARES